MAAYGTHNIPTPWDDERDNAFFRITATLFSSEFTYGASVLLASYDDECAAVTAAAEPLVTTPAATSSAHPAPVR